MMKIASSEGVRCQGANKEGLHFGQGVKQTPDTALKD